jgi:hypothetical protein
VEILTLTRIAGGESFNLLEGAAVSGADPVVLRGSKTGIPAGYYLLRTLLKNSEGLYAGKSEAAHVYRNLTARAELADYTFTAEDFNGALTAVKTVDYAAYDSDQQFSAALQELLEYLPNGNTPGDPVFLKVQGLDVSTKLSVLTGALTRYASLDLSECGASLQDVGYAANGPWGYIDLKESKWVTDLVLPSAVVNLNQYFNNTYSNLRSFVAPGVTKMNHSIFHNCAYLERVELPAMRVMWGQANFADCPSLTTVIIPSVEIIGERTFRNDTALETIEVGQLTSIGRETFDGANPDFDFIVSGAMTWVPAIRQLLRSDEGAVSILAWLKDERSPADLPEGLTKIGDSLFYRMTNITSIDLPASVIEIGDRAFYGCSSLAQASMPGVKRVGVAAFFETALVEVDLPEATYVGAEAFSLCLQLESVKLPKVVEIGPNSLFYKAGKLASVDLGDSLETIGYSAFIYCSKLESLTLPGTVTFIGSGAFASGCGIKTITVNAVEPPVVETYIFGGSISHISGEPYPYPLETIFVPAGSVDAYKSAPEWSYYAKHIKPIK